jgi:hypothetical protein
LSSCVRRDGPEYWAGAERRGKPGRFGYAAFVRAAMRVVNRDLYRPAALRWMIPFDAMRSMSEMVCFKALFAAPKSLASIAVRMAFSALLKRERNWRLCSRFFRLCLCAFSADACVATYSSTSGTPKLSTGTVTPWSG